MKSLLQYRGALISGNARNKIGRGGRVYPSKKYSDFKKAFPWMLKHIGGVNKFFNNERLEVVLNVYSVKQDADGSAKTILDCLQGIVFKNDGQIDKLIIEMYRDGTLSGFDVGG